MNVVIFTRYCANPAIVFAMFLRLNTRKIITNPLVNTPHGHTFNQSPAVFNVHAPKGSSYGSYVDLVTLLSCSFWVVQRPLSFPEPWSSEFKRSNMVLWNLVCAACHPRTWKSAKWIQAALLINDWPHLRNHVSTDVLREAKGHSSHAIFGTIPKFNHHGA